MKYFPSHKKYIYGQGIKKSRPYYSIYLPVAVVLAAASLVMLQQVTKPSAGIEAATLQKPSNQSGVTKVSSSNPGNSKGSKPGGSTSPKSQNGSSGQAAQSTGSTASALASTASLQHANIITTIFWAGEPADGDNGFISNSPSAWDEQWESHYGGVDSQSPRNGYYPAAFTPKENPFYFALPYNDFTNNGNRKSSATLCANSGNPSLSHYSWCKNTWIAIKHGNKTAYAQWEDVGPFEENDTAYVFGSAAPKNQQEAKAGLDVSPAVSSYLGLQDVDKSSWAFISADKVPAGPWRQIVTTSKGTSN
ncbi:MAG TPA: hypothetical protein VK534_01145 [Methylomirabilota bacterium]|nr:hypothetical protein [Methylomirabilota bacterium]